jgi:hypothetical protein
MVPIKSMSQMRIEVDTTHRKNKSKQKSSKDPMQRGLMATK